MSKGMKMRHVTTKVAVEIISVDEGWVTYRRLFNRGEFMKPVYVMEAMYREVKS